MDQPLKVEKMYADEPGTCPEPKSGKFWGATPPCARPFTTDAQREARLCGQHLAGRKRREAKELAEQRLEEARRELEAVASRAVVALTDLGIPAKVVVTYFGNTVVALDPDVADQLAARLSATPTE